MITGAWYWSQPPLSSVPANHAASQVIFTWSHGPLRLEADKRERMTVPIEQTFYW